MIFCFNIHHNKNIDLQDKKEGYNRNIMVCIYMLFVQQKE